MFTYKSSNGHSYYFVGGGTLPHVFSTHLSEQAEDREADSSGYVTAIPEGYDIVENSSGIPFLISKNHSRQSPNCQWERILELVDKCDQTWYTFALAPPISKLNKEARVREWISELETIETMVSCPECLRELKYQIRFQKDGIGMRD
jgi:hypothetical protein